MIAGTKAGSVFFSVSRPFMFLGSKVPEHKHYLILMVKAKLELCFPEATDEVERITRLPFVWDPCNLCEAHERETNAVKVLWLWQN